MRIILITLIIYLKINIIYCDTNVEITTTDLVLMNINKEIWSTDESKCLQDTVSILNNVKNNSLWATWIWSSNQYLTGTFYGSRFSLGNYDQCLNVRSIPGAIKTQYCLSELKFVNNENDVEHSSDRYINTKLDSGRVLNIAYWGSCLPATCSPRSVSKILRAMYSTSPITSTVPQITVEHCQVAGAKQEYGYGFYGFFILIASFVTISLIATFLEDNSSTSSAIMKSFCIKKNYSTLTKLSNDDITILSFLKSSLAILAVLTHTILVKIGVSMSNGVEIDEVILGTETILQKYTKHIDKLIEVFLIISGLLLVKGLVRGDKTPTLTLISRYFRLMGVFSIVLLYTSSVMIHLGDGPQWPRLAGREAKASADNWLNSLLMINNYVNAENIGLIVAWFIPCDFQLSILGVVLFYLWQNNKKVAKIVTAITIVLAPAIPAIETYCRGLSGLLVYKNMEAVMDLRKNTVYLNTYIKSHARMGSYLLGLALGYLMARYKPTKNRNVINRSQSMSLFLLIAATLQTIVTDLSPYTNNSAFYAVMHATTGRISFSLVIVALIIVVEYGDLPYFRSFTQLPIFSVVNKLAYGIYLVHTIVLFHLEYSRKNPTQFRSVLYEGFIEGSKTVIITVTISFGLWLFVEAPISNLVNHFTRSKRKNI